MIERDISAACSFFEAHIAQDFGTGFEMLRSKLITLRRAPLSLRATNSLLLAH